MNIGHLAAVKQLSKSDAVYYFPVECSAGFKHFSPFGRARMGRTQKKNARSKNASKGRKNPRETLAAGLLVDSITFNSFTAAKWPKSTEKEFNFCEWF